MKFHKLKPVFRGVTAVTAAVLTLSTVGYGIAMSPLAQGWVDGFFGINTRDIYEEREIEGITAFKKQHNSLAEFADALVAHGIKQGEEGFALLKNDNSALPLASGSNVTLFGWNAYNLPTGHTGVVAGNAPGDVKSGRPAAKVGTRYEKAEQITLASAFKKMEGITLNETVTAADFKGAMKKAPSDFGIYEIPEVFEAKDTWNIPTGSIGIVAVGRGGGEGANYKTDAAKGAEDPLALSAEELEMIDYAKSKCAKVVVLVVSANAMELGPIAKGGAHEVDAIGFCGIPNDYQYGGVANVLAGKVNATGGLTDTYVYDNSFTPATVNMGEQEYADKTSIGFASLDDDPYKRLNIPKGQTEGRVLTAEDMNANWYIVQAEGIYVGYKYYETRYYDSIVDPTNTKATATIGSTNGQAWNYANEVVYTFGHGLSYVPYTQEVKEVTVDLSENGNITAKVDVHNSGAKAADFTAQLYVNKPYTKYDKDNKVEKSAVDFLNSARVHVAAGGTETVEITLPTRYLASYDEYGAKTYILDPGDYYFTAAAGAHEAVNNILKAQGKTTDGTTNGTGKATVWNQLKSRDTKTFATSNGYKVTNQAPDADINYYLPGKVTYMTRADWTTYPKNYTNYQNGSGIAPEAAFKLADSAKKDEWIKQLRNLQYMPTTGYPTSNVEGIIPEDVGEGKEYATVWDWITSFKLRHPEAFEDVNSDEWNEFAAALNINEAVGAILHGGNTTDSLSVGNPTSVQSESVAGYSQTLTIVPGDIDTKKLMTLNIASNTMLGISFDPKLAYEWGLLEGECGLWLMEEQKAGPITVWGAGLNLHRHAYNGRNSEYMSEDPMLTNRLGYEQIRAAMSMGAIVGPKHMGFNDQELHRQGIAEYMTEQKMRETDIRCYEGALRANEGNGNGVMMSFARIGSVNVTNREGLIRNIMRQEWGFDGIISTDMGQKYYHEPFSIINATINQYAGFGANDSFIGKNGKDFDDAAADSTWSYVTMKVLKGDNFISERARETNKYQLYTIANSAAYNIRQVKEGETGEKIKVMMYVGRKAHEPWENIFISIIAISAVLTGLAGAAWIASVVMPNKEEE